MPFQVIRILKNIVTNRPKKIKYDLSKLEFN